MTVALVDAAMDLASDDSRVVSRLFLPGEGFARGEARSARIIERVGDMSEETVAAVAADVIARFRGRHGSLRPMLERHARTVASRSGRITSLTPDSALVLGSMFTAEYAIEGAALCNPSAVPHPDQSGLDAGQLRLAIALRAIGEGHVSSITFATAVVGPGARGRLEARAVPLVAAAIGDGEWARAHLRHCLDADGWINEIAALVIADLPETFRTSRVAEAIASVPTELADREDVRIELEAIRRIAGSAYRAGFDSSTTLSQRVLLPAAAEESHGVEDARLVRFDHEDGTVDYRATYTAYDGRSIASRLVVSSDLRTFHIHRLTGSGASDKGLALFPRRIGGSFMAITRARGEDLALAASDDGLAWRDTAVLRRPVGAWELVQTGNCGPPLETPHGWLVLVHGVGPMRTYGIGAVLLDLDDPSIVLAHLEQPFVRALGTDRDGYVPNVVYSCGGVIHAGRLWLPYGVGDKRVRVGSILVDDLLAAMTRLEPGS